MKPGDRTQIQGVFRCLPNEGTSTSGMFRQVLIATGTQSLNAEKEHPNISGTDYRNIMKLAKNKNIFNIMSDSVAPSISGYDMVKKSMLL